VVARPPPSKCGASRLSHPAQLNRMPANEAVILAHMGIMIAMKTGNLPLMRYPLGQFHDIK
jgi:hypothetical protein